MLHRHPFKSLTSVPSHMCGEAVKNGNGAGGETPAPPGDTAAAGGQTPSTTLANAAAARQSVPATLSNGARAGGAPSAAPAATAAPKLAGGASADGLHAGAVVPVSPAATPAPKPAHGVSPDGGLSGAPAGTVVHPTRDSVHSPTNPRHGATFLQLFGATSGTATEDAAVIAIRSPGVAAPLPICCRSTTCCRSPRGVARSRPISSWRALLITECAMATDRLRRRSRRRSACTALLPLRSSPLADGLQVARRDTLRSAARRACIFAAASSGPGVLDGRCGRPHCSRPRSDVG